MHTIGILAYSEPVLDDIPELVRSLERMGYPVHIEQMGDKLATTRLGDFYYQENAVLLWLCQCFRDAERTQEALDKFIEAGVRLIIAMSAPAFEIALRQPGEAVIPVLFTHVSQPQMDQFSLTGLLSGRIFTGILDIWQDIAEDRLALLTKVVPTPTTVHAIYNPAWPPGLDEAQALAQAAQRLDLAIELHAVPNSSAARIELETLKTRRDHALIRLADPVTAPLAGLMGAVAAEHSIPYLGLTPDELEKYGALFALDVQGVGKKLAELVDRGLKGADVGAIPPAAPQETALAVNLQAAQDLGLILSPVLLEQAKFTLQGKQPSSLGVRLLLVLMATALFWTVFTASISHLDLPYFLSLTLLVTASLALSLWVYIDRTIIRPLRRLTIAAVKIGAGDLDSSMVEPKVEDEISVLARALRGMRRNLRHSYAELEHMRRSLEIRIEELTTANQALQQAQRELEIAGRRIIEADDASRFAMTTYIHDEILRPLDDLINAARRQGDFALVSQAEELEDRLRRLRFELSVPILQDIGLELRRLIQEILPMIYPNGWQIRVEMDLEALDQLPNLEPAVVFLLYRFAHGAVSNAFRHAGASQVAVTAMWRENRLYLRVADNGRGFDRSQVEQYVKNGHYFFHDIQIRARQLKGALRVESQPGEGVALEVFVPIKAAGRGLAREATRRQESKSQSMPLR